MILSIQEAQDLLHRALGAAGYDHAQVKTIADHLLDSELRGLSEGGLSRCLSIIERLNATPDRPRPIRVVRETHASATLDGGDQVGYLVAQQATDIAIKKTSKAGVAVIGAHETWYTGMFSYYLEQITARGYVGMIAGSGMHIVAPHGGTEPRFATNPIAFGFPSDGSPIIYDIGTSTIILADAVLAKRMGRSLNPGEAFDKQGQPTLDPAEALQGALTVWGGHRGSGLALSIQLLGMLAGASAAPQGLRDCGLMIWTVNPEILTSASDFTRRVGEYADSIRATRPEIPDRPVRVPFERSLADRQRRIQSGEIEVEEPIVAALRAFIASKTA